MGSAMVSETIKAGAMKIRINTPYPIVDTYRNIGPNTHNVRAVWTGEKRKPRKGEWYLSGAIIEAYLAPARLDWECPIAKLVTVQTRTVTTITGDYKP
jgi:hypothetical protein